MKMNKGFTLIEIIVTLLMIAVVAAMVLPYLYTTLMESGTPMWRLKDSLSLRQVMENITLDYYNIPLDVLKSNIGAETSSQTNAYGSYRVVKNRFIDFSDNNEIDGGSNLLKVTLADSAGEQLTTLFYRKE